MAIKCPKCQTNNPDTQKFCGECATPLPSPKDVDVTRTLEIPTDELTRGTTFAGRYEIIEELGKGGMGKVYRVLDKKLKEEIALKLIKPEIAKDKKTVERFSNELKIARKIAHKNIARMFDLNEEKGTHYITMEYVRGEDLKGLIRKIGRLGAGQAIPIAKQICEGLAEAHRLGVVHRDLKPQNVMVDEDGNARIMDFGIAWSLESKGITGAGVIIGTPEYMSPEQVEAKEVDQHSDIYSLGIILYEMTTGRLPFEAYTPFAVGVKQKSEEPENPKDINPQIPDDLNRVIMRCLEKDKDARYQSAGEVRYELDQIEKGIPTTEREVPAKKPLTSKEITVQFSVKKIFIPAFIFIAVVIIGIIIWQVLPKKQAVSIPSDKPALAVMYFENNTGDETLEYLRSGLAEWLITDLSQSRLIDVLSGDKVFSILKKLNLLETDKYSSENLAKVAKEGGANHTLKGTYIKIGDHFVITVMLQKPHTGELISSKEVRCRGEEEIPQKIDELTRMIKLDLNIPRKQIASDIDREVGKITTSSPEAYRYYSEARKYHDKADHRRAIQFYEKAIEVDPDFAMAYRGMETAYNNMGYISKGRECAQRALELADRLSDSERYIIQAQFYWRSEKTYDKSIEAFIKLLELYPKHSVGNTNLGNLYSSIEEWDKAIERLEVMIRDEDETYYPYINILEPYAAKGAYEKAQEVLEYYLKNFTEDSTIYWGLALNYLYQGKYDLALVEIDKALSFDQDYYYTSTKGDIFHCRGDLFKAEEEYHKLLDSEEQVAYCFGRARLGPLYLLQGRFEESKDQASLGIEIAKKLEEKGWESYFHNMLAYLHIKTGNFESALKECEDAWKSASEWELLFFLEPTLYLKAKTFLSMKSLDKARKTAYELKDIIEEGMNRKAIRLYDHLMGMIELEEENYSGAFSNFEKATSLLPFQSSDFDIHALFIEPLASAYYKAGNLEKAREEYKRIVFLTTGRINYGDIYAKSFYMLGRIYEQQGNAAKAIEHYKKFLDLWKDADPGIAEVEDAKKRLAGLKELP
ncbi:MAG: protein kinase [Candidatus Aminicenantes bacterium]|nr:MAG: protein kinase [Candidatus Aminicenantes bacterium]